MAFSWKLADPVLASFHLPQSRFPALPYSRLPKIIGLYWLLVSSHRKILFGFSWEIKIEFWRSRLWFLRRRELFVEAPVPSLKHSRIPSFSKLTWPVLGSIFINSTSSGTEKSFLGFVLQYFWHIGYRSIEKRQPWAPVSCLRPKTLYFMQEKSSLPQFWRTVGMKSGV